MVIYAAGTEAIMTWWHLVDQNGNHWVLSPNSQFYFFSTAVDGSAPIYMKWPVFGLSWIITAEDFGLIVSPLPTAYTVQTPN